MDVSVLEIFVEVMRHGSFAAVARDRNIDPSSVSRSIAGLEKELGIRLFQRTTRHLSPTEAGRSYFARIAPLMEELQQAFDVTTDFFGQPKGKLRVTTSVSFGLKCIVPILSRFEALYSDLIVELALTDRIIDLLTERIDVAIRLGILEDSTLIAQRLINTKYRICASPKYLEDHGQLEKPSDIENHNCLLFPLPGFRSRWIFKDKQGNISEFPVRGRTIISNAVALQQCAIAGMGLALLPHWLIDNDIETGHLISVLPNYEITATDFNTAAWFVYPSRAYVPLKVKVFIDFFKENITKTIGHGQ